MDNGDSLAHHFFSKRPIKISDGPSISWFLHANEWDMGHWLISWSFHILDQKYPCKYFVLAKKYNNILLIEPCKHVTVCFERVLEEKKKTTMSRHDAKCFHRTVLCLTLCVLLFCKKENCRLLIFFQKYSFRNTIRVTNNFDRDQDQRFVRSDLGPNCLQRLSADDTSRKRAATLLAPHPVFKHPMKME